jgi:ubiquinone/menaquinone biosynthesis C-methylase UbiE
MKNDHFKLSEETWNTIAESFDATRKHPWEDVVTFINEASQSDVIADLGCGNGRHIMVCPIRCKKIIGFDLSKQLLNIVQSKVTAGRLTNVDLIHGNLVSIPLKESSVDIVLYIASLHNIKGRGHRITSLKEIKRILNENGRALISVWSREQEQFKDCFSNKGYSGDKELGDIEIYWNQNKLHEPRFYHLYTKNEFIGDLITSGLIIEKMFGTKIQSKECDDNYFAIVRKK